MKCMACSGSGTQGIVFTDKETEETETKEFTCVVCKGDGKVNNRIFESVDNEQGIWCMCLGEKDPYSRYYGANEHSDLSTHHWRCRKCDKVTQIG